MSQSEHDANRSTGDLVEPEGVNAGSGGAGDMRPGGDAQAGGDPSAAPSPEPEAESRELTGVPDQNSGDGAPPDGQGPGQELAAGEG